MKKAAKVWVALLVGALTLLAPAVQVRAWAQVEDQGQAAPDPANQLITLMNQARAAQGAGALQWDPALAAAAEQHCLLMTQKGPIEHQYKGEPGLADRASAAGAHFSLIEENIAIGPSAEAIAQEWLHSPPHRANLLNPSVNRVGTAIVAANGTLYAVADFSRAVMVLTPSQVEAQVGNLIQVSGVKVLADDAQARRACASEEIAQSSALLGHLPRFMMLWQASSLDRLPKTLTDKLATGQYHSAEVGSCAAQGGQNAFAAYRVAVLLY